MNHPYALHLIILYFFAWILINPMPWYLHALFLGGIITHIGRYMLSVFIMMQAIEDFNNKRRN